MECSEPLCGNTWSNPADTATQGSFLYLSEFFIDELQWCISRSIRVIPTYLTAWPLLSNQVRISGNKEESSLLKWCPECLASFSQVSVLESQCWPALFIFYFLQGQSGRSLPPWHSPLTLPSPPLSSLPPHPHTHAKLSLENSIITTKCKHYNTLSNQMFRLSFLRSKVVLENLRMWLLIVAYHCLILGSLFASPCLRFSSVNPPKINLLFGEN